MQIQVNKNIDEYKDDFFKGLTLQQTAAAAATLTAGAGTFALLAYGLKLPVSLAIYGAFPVAFPFAASGFLKIHGMGLVEWVKMKRQVRKQPLLVYEPCLLVECAREDTSEKREKREILLVSHEEQYLRMSKLQKLCEEEGRETAGNAEHERL